jgi:hypothetical protein
MKRSMLFVCAGLLAFAVGCGKKKDDKKNEEVRGSDLKPGEAKDDTKPADPAQPTEEAAAGAGTADMVAICKKIEELATKEGGKALEVYNARLKDCVKDMGAEAAKKGPEVTKEFGDCVNAAPSFTAALENCKQF